MDSENKVHYHLTVLAEEVIDNLNITPGGVYVDMTLGDGGHSLLVIRQLSEGGRLIAFDKDDSAIARARVRIEAAEPGCGNYEFIKSDFADCISALKGRGITAVDGFIFDLGVSSPQLDEAQRGFSFSKEARLDMRMDRQGKIDAHELVNTLSQEELSLIIKKYGEERFARRIARGIIWARTEGEIVTTKQLADIIYKSVPRKFHPKRIHPATKTFQAFRIEVNNELSSVETGLNDAISFLKEGGRICAISFNSLEDRIIKRAFKKGVKGCICPKEFFYCQCGIKPYIKLVTRKPITASEEELDANPRSRSAKLRIAERI